MYVDYFRSNGSGVFVAFLLDLIAFDQHSSLSMIGIPTI
jgi:hypothetical protein